MKFQSLSVLATIFALFSTGEMRNLLRLQHQSDCIQANASGQCIKCAFRFVLIEGQCVAVSDQCKKWDQNTGGCTQCYGGYILTHGSCKVNQTQQNSDPYCISTNSSGECTKCAYRTVFIDDKCKPVSDQCKTWDQTTGQCTQCYTGWTLTNGVCHV